MAKFNKKPSISEQLVTHPDAMKNYEGSIAFVMDAKTELMTRVLTALVSEDKFYTSGKDADTELNRAINIVLETDPEFVLKLAAYARNVMNLRSVPLVLLNKFSNSGSQVVGSRKYVPACVQRVDEITELLALNLQDRKKPAQFIKNGLKPCFNKFDRYQYGKYNRDGAVKLKDAIFLCHPKADSEERQNIFNDIVNSTLEPPETWEVAISTKGSNQENWQAIIPKMGYMAILRNLNNFLKHDVDLTPVIKILTDENAVKKSKQFPFRFFSAFRAIQQENNFGKNITPLLDALNKAMELSINNIPKIPGNTLVLIDVSGSMSSSSISKNSSITPSDISCLFGAISAKICERADLFPFGERTTQIMYSSTNGILDIMEKLKRANVGHATYAFLPMEYARQNKNKYDRVFLFSDMQCYGDPGWYTGHSFAETFIRYQREVNPAFLYSFDLTGYGSAQIPQDNPKVCTVTGWSEKVLEFVSFFESDKGTMLQVVESYKNS